MYQCVYPHLPLIERYSNASHDITSYLITWLEITLIYMNLKVMSVPQVFSHISFERLLASFSVKHQAEIIIKLK